MTTPVMSWIIARRRAVDGLSAVTATGVPSKGNTRSSAVRARSMAFIDPLAPEDNRADGETFDQPTTAALMATP